MATKLDDVHNKQELESLKEREGWNRRRTIIRRDVMRVVN